MSPPRKQRNDGAFAGATWVVVGCLMFLVWFTVLVLVLAIASVVYTANSCALRSCLAVVDRAKAEANPVRIF